MKLHMRICLLLLLLPVIATSACGPRNDYLKTVVGGTGVYSKTVVLDVVGAQFNIKSPKKLFRDDGLYEGNLSIHTQELEPEFTADSINTSGKDIEGLVTEGTRPDGTTCLVIYGLTTGDRLLDQARREMLRADAVIKLGMRDGLEQFFRHAGVKIQFKMVSDRGLTKLVEAYALTRINCPLDRVRDLETRQMAQLLLNQGIGKDSSRPVGTRHLRPR
jgi:hypothetical protein